MYYIWTKQQCVVFTQAAEFQDSNEVDGKSESKIDDREVFYYYSGMRS